MRRPLSIVLGVLVTMVTTAACVVGGHAGDQARVLTVQIEGEPEDNQVYLSLVARFQEANPSVEVRLIQVSEEGEDATAKLTTRFAAGNPPDVFLINYREYSQFVARGGIEPVGPHLDEAGIDLSGYYEEALGAFRYGGELQCMPQNVSSLVVYYNTVAFARAGLEHPRSGWRFEDLRAAARALVDHGSEGLGIEPKLIRLAPFVWSNGGEIVDDPQRPSRFTLEQPEARSALEFLVGLVRDGLVPSEEEVASEDLETQFVTGRLGMYLGSRRDAAKFREVLGFDWDVASLPVARRPASILHSDAFCIAAGASPLDAALAFVRYATGREAQTLGALSGRLVPSLRSVATSNAFLDQTQPPRHARVFLDAIPHMRRTPVIPTWPQIEELGDEILHRAFYDEGYGVSDATTDLRRATDELFAEAAK
ncbi:MAG: sugar ABC transporter substrate-binding protein [Actinomycetota bacterium]